MENKREKMSEENQNQHQHQDQGEAKKTSQEQNSISQNPSFGLAASLIFLPLSSLICILPTGNTTTNLLITCFWITQLPSDENMYLPFMK